MSELERLVVLLGLALQESGQLGDSDEAKALLEVIDARCESAREYHKQTRGIDALERIAARTEERDVDYRTARVAAAKASQKEE